MASSKILGSRVKTKAANNVIQYSHRPVLGVSRVLISCKRRSILSIMPISIAYSFARVFVDSCDKSKLRSES